MSSTGKERFAADPVAGFQIPLSHLLGLAKEEIDILFPHIEEKYIHQLKIQVVREPPTPPHLGEASIKKTGIFLLSVKILRPPRPLPLF